MQALNPFYSPRMSIRCQNTLMKQTRVTWFVLVDLILYITQLAISNFREIVNLPVLFIINLKYSSFLIIAIAKSVFFSHSYYDIKQATWTLYHVLWRRESCCVLLTTCVLVLSSMKKYFTVAYSNKNVRKKLTNSFPQGS